MTYKKLALINLAIVAFIIGAYFGVRYIIKIRNTAIFAGQQTEVISKFLTTTFPEQVKAFDEANKPK